MLDQSHRNFVGVREMMENSSSEDSETANHCAGWEPPSHGGTRFVLRPRPKTGVMPPRSGSSFVGKNVETAQSSASGMRQRPRQGAHSSSSGSQDLQHSAESAQDDDLDEPPSSRDDFALLCSLWRHLRGGEPLEKVADLAWFDHFEGMEYVAYHECLRFYQISRRAQLVAEGVLRRCRHLGTSSNSDLWQPPSQELLYLLVSAARMPLEAADAYMLPDGASYSAPSPHEVPLPRSVHSRGRLPCPKPDVAPKAQGQGARPSTAPMMILRL